MPKSFALLPCVHDIIVRGGRVLVKLVDFLGQMSGQLGRSCRVDAFAGMLHQILLRIHNTSNHSSVRPDGVRMCCVPKRCQIADF